MVVEIYHIKDTTKPYNVKGKFPIETKDYDWVYTWTTENTLTVEELFRVFNFMHPEGYNVRSVCVGDIFIIDGIPHLVCMLGFNTIVDIPNDFRALADESAIKPVP